MIQTERLGLRRPTEADVESPPAWLDDPEVMDWLGGVEPAADVVRMWVEQWERFPTGKFLVERKGDGAVVTVGSKGEAVPVSRSALPKLKARLMSQDRLGMERQATESLS